MDVLENGRAGSFGNSHFEVAPRRRRQQEADPEHVRIEAAQHSFPCNETAPLHPYFAPLLTQRLVDVQLVEIIFVRRRYFDAVQCEFRMETLPAGRSDFATLHRRYDGVLDRHRRLSFPRCIFQPERHQVLGGRFEHVLRHDELGADATKMCVFVVIEGKIVASFARDDLPLVVLIPVCVAVFLADGSEVGLHLVVGGVGDRGTVLFAAATQCRPSESSIC
jgi:hypothetical protein